MCIIHSPGIKFVSVSIRYVDIVISLFKKHKIKDKQIKIILNKEIIISESISIFWKSFLI